MSSHLPHFVAALIFGFGTVACDDSNRSKVAPTSPADNVALTRIAVAGDCTFYRMIDDRNQVIYIGVGYEYNIGITCTVALGPMIDGGVAR